MAGENRKFLWIALSLCVFVLILVAAGLLLFNPRGDMEDRPASAANTAAPKATDPQDFLVTPPPAPTDSTGRSATGDVIVVYGNPLEPTSTTVQRTSPIPGSSSTTNRAATTTSTIPGTTTSTSVTRIPLTPVVPPSDVPVAAAEPREPIAPAVPNTTTTIKKPAPKPPAPKPPVQKPPVPKQAPKPAAASAPVPKTTATTAEDGIAWIQTGSFTLRAGADRLRDAFTDAGISSVIMVKDIDGKSWYQVRIGPFSGKAQAREWLTRVKAVPGASNASYVTSD